MIDLKLLESELSETFTSCGLSQYIAALNVPRFVPDQTFIYLLGKGSLKAVLHLSPHAFPNVAADAQLRAATMRSYLGNELGSAILEPLAQGQFLERSFVILPYCREFSGNRFIWQIQKLAIKQAIIEWLQSIAQRYRLAAISAEQRSCFTSSLEALILTPTIDLEIRAAAENSLTRLQNNKFQPFFVPMHNDLWKQNLLRPKSSNAKYPFTVIDWNGSQINGFPVYDLIRLSHSFNLSASELRKELIRLASILECDPVDIRSYLLAALGNIAANLNQFPLEAFIHLVQDTMKEIKKADF